MPHRLPIFRRLGRRGTALALLGSLWLVYGVAQLVAPEPTRPAHPWLYHELLPVWLRALLWMVTGSVALVYAGKRAGVDRWGFVALVVMPMLRGSSFGASGITYLLTRGDLGYSLGILNALVWTVVVALVMLIAGWPEPPDQQRLQQLRSDVEQLAAGEIPPARAGGNDEGEL